MNFIIERLKNVEFADQSFHTTGPQRRLNCFIKEKKSNCQRKGLETWDAV